MTTRDTDRTGVSGPDPLAEIVRAAGRRKAPPELHYQQVFAAAHQAWRQKVRSRRRSRWLAIAASLAILVTGGLLAWLIQADRSVPVAVFSVAQGSVEQLAPGAESWVPIAVRDAAVLSGTRIRTSAEGRTSLGLVEGGSLRLNTNTEIAVEAEAIVLAVGRIYFDSDGRSPEMAMQIETPFGAIRDIGTQFEVSVERNYLQIRVREGEVEILESSAPGELRAVAGDEIELVEGRLIRRIIAPDADAWSWVQALANVPFRQAQSILTYFRWISRETGKRLEFESDSTELAAELSSFGGDPAGLTPLELLSAITATSDFRYSMTTDGAILIGRD